MGQKRKLESDSLTSTVQYRTKKEEGDTRFHSSEIMDKDSLQRDKKKNHKKSEEIDGTVKGKGKGKGKGKEKVDETHTKTKRKLSQKEDVKPQYDQEKEQHQKQKQKSSIQSELDALFAPIKIKKEKEKVQLKEEEELQRKLKKQRLEAKRIEVEDMRQSHNSSNSMVGTRFKKGWEDKTPSIVPKIDDNNGEGKPFDSQNDDVTATPWKYGSDGMKIYCPVAMKLERGGRTKLCPFDCNCCF